MANFMMKMLTFIQTLCKKTYSCLNQRAKQGSNQKHTRYICMCTGVEVSSFFSFAAWPAEGHFNLCYLNAMD